MESAWVSCVDWLLKGCEDSGKYACRRSQYGEKTTSARNSRSPTAIAVARVCLSAHTVQFGKYLTTVPFDVPVPVVAETPVAYV